MNFSHLQDVEGELMLVGLIAFCVVFLYYKLDHIFNEIKKVNENIEKLIKEKEEKK